MEQERESPELNFFIPPLGIFALVFKVNIWIGNTRGKETSKAEHP